MSGQRGFTLLELLIAMALLALLAATLAGSLRFGARSWDAAAERGRAWSEVAAVQGFLRTTLGRSQPLGSGAEGEAEDEEDAPVAGRPARPVAGAPAGPPAEAPLAFAGGPASLRFVAPLGERFGPPGLYRLELRVAPGAAGRGLALRLRWQLLDGPPGRPSPAALAASGERLLLDGFTHLAFAYRGAPGEEGAPPWLPEWRERALPPRLLRLEGERPVAGRESWIPLILALEVDLDARCSLEALAELCD